MRNQIIQAKCTQFCRINSITIDNCIKMALLLQHAGTRLCLGSPYAAEQLEDVVQGCVQTVAEADLQGGGRALTYEHTNVSNIFKRTTCSACLPTQILGPKSMPLSQIRSTEDLQPREMAGCSKINHKSTVNGRNDFPFGNAFLHYHSISACWMFHGEHTRHVLLEDVPDATD